MSVHLGIDHNSLRLKSFTLISLGILLSLFISSSASANDYALNAPKYYPPFSTTKLRIGDENYQKKHMTLKGLPGVFIDLSFVESASKKAGVTIYSDLSRRIEVKLNSAGLKLLSKEEVELTPGQPKMDIYPNLPSGLVPPNVEAIDSHIDEDDPYRYDNLECCTASIWASFSQGGKVLRQPDYNYRMGTWGKGNNTHDCSDLGLWLSVAVLETVDAFISDFKKAEEEDAKIIAKSKEPLERTDYPECNTAIMLYAELFATNATNMSISKLHIMQNIAESMKRCQNFRYLIETHADQRSSHEYNARLSAKRAESIRAFLLAQNVPKEQFEVQSFGETRLATLGTSQSDYATNRRVVVTPFRIR